MKRWQKIVIILIAVLAVAFFGISAFLGVSMTVVERVAVELDPALLGLEYENVTFPSRQDSLTLHGWLITARNDGRIVIMVHGSDMHRADPNIDMPGIAASLANSGYSVLMFDLRGHGESEGKRLSAGYHERKDVAGAVEFVKGRGYEQIGVLGFSMGGAASLIAAAENDDIDCLVIDSSFADMTEIIEREFKERSGMPGFFLPPMLFMVKLMYGVDFNAVKPIESAPEIAPRPIFFIHGEEDTFVPPEHAARLYEAAQGPDDILWMAPGAEHVRSYISNPEEYIARLTSFLDEALE